MQQRNGAHADHVVTTLLDAWRGGDAEAGRRILAIVYDELHGLAAGCLRREAVGHTLQPTALVHEVYLRLAGEEGPGCENRAHLLGIAARSMRQILVNHAKRRGRIKRGGDRRRVTLEPAVALFEERCIDLLALDEALERLRELDPRQCRVVEMRFFGGMTVEEAATALDASVRTIERDWTMARAWLRREIGGG